MQTQVHEYDQNDRLGGVDEVVGADDAVPGDAGTDGTAIAGDRGATAGIVEDARLEPSIFNRCISSSRSVN
jgi:hypothetical protein